MIAIAPSGTGWQLTAPSHRALWTHLADGGGADLTALLVGLDTPACFWECAPLNAATADDPWEAMVLPTRAFEGRRTNPRPLHRQLSGPGPDIRVFTNLSGDATLVSPVVTGDFPHLLAFLRTAPASMATALWTATAASVLPHLDRDRPLWVSTHGLGVFWLHVRLDQRPKYYHHRPYRTPPRS